MIKMVVSDIDGTLLPEGTDQMNPEYYEVIRELKLVAMAPASDENGAAVKLGSKLRALELLGKHLGIFEGKNGAGLAKVEIREDL